jgi:hypothetical protein
MSAAAEKHRSTLAEVEQQAKESFAREDKTGNS